MKSFKISGASLRALLAKSPVRIRDAADDALRPVSRGEASALTRTDGKAQGDMWGGDIPVALLEDFIGRSRAIGWRTALDEVATERPQFAHRLRNLPLGNWHLLRALSPDNVALDVGCGFGSLALGLSDHFRLVVGLDALWTRVSYGAVRAREDSRGAIRFVQGGGFALPFRGGAFNLVTMNGVLEWAALYSPGAPRTLQVAMLKEVGRVLHPNGTVAIAIENRFAMETLVGMVDTHTGLRLVPALPRRVAGFISSALRRKPYRTFLYNAAGYRRLLSDAGYADVRIFDLVSSYNDYDFVVLPGDAATYQLLWDAGLVRTFSPRAGKVRRSISRRWPKALGRFAYAYLVFGGRNVPTVLDADHPLWERAASLGVTPGKTRFACQGSSVGSLGIVAHDGKHAVGALELSTRTPSVAHTMPILSERLRKKLGLSTEAAEQWEYEGLEVRLVKRLD
jgi:SAM-dependent methyltransferase